MVWLREKGPWSKLIYQMGRRFKECRGCIAGGWEFGGGKARDRGGEGTAARGLGRHGQYTTTHKETTNTKQKQCAIVLTSTVDSKGWRSVATISVSVWYKISQGENRTHVPGPKLNAW